MKMYSGLKLFAQQFLGHTSIEIGGMCFLPPNSFFLYLLDMMAFEKNDEIHSFWLSAKYLLNLVIFAHL
jgi:hypothetical protein